MRVQGRRSVVVHQVDVLYGVLHLKQLDFIVVVVKVVGEVLLVQHYLDKGIHQLAEVDQLELRREVVLEEEQVELAGRRNFLTEVALEELDFLIQLEEHQRLS